MEILFITLGVSAIILIIAVKLLRYRNKIEKEIFEDSNREWEKNYSLTIDPFVPDDKMRKAIDSNRELEKQTKRKVYKTSGIPPNKFSSDPYISTHNVIWDVSDDSTKQGFIGTDTTFEGFGSGGSFGGGGSSGSWDSSSSSSDWSSSSSFDSGSSFGD